MTEANTLQNEPRYCNGDTALQAPVTTVQQNVNVGAAWGQARTSEVCGESINWKAALLFLSSLHSSGRPSTARSGLTTSPSRNLAESITPEDVVPASSSSSLINASHYQHRDMTGRAIFVLSKPLAKAFQPNPFSPKISSPIQPCWASRSADPPDAKPARVGAPSPPTKPLAAEVSRFE
ncbi:uncharacterized protein CIMG_10623 [Coccidioides immitis RS]|uniref:Uncharacterized protein n=1 Tax=Coccidioides immitis (strain RS) TaxID=246410 RepID=A0A0D8JVF8_COCIM|nr:uncharacterized protein CIMG_10623 [Coccidioides immitis RS]KJF60263.1 hypothetical protein CIMG_10623 [Coccidioides immitis RS]